MSSGIFIDIEGLDEIWKLRKETPKKFATLTRRLHSDLVTRVPKPVSNAVASVYTIKQRDVVARKQNGYGKRTMQGGAAVYTRGDVLDAISIEFRGQRSANFPTFANGKSTLPKREGKIGKRGKYVSYMPKYKVTVETFKDAHTEITPSDDSRVFVLPRKTPGNGKGGKLTAMVIKKGWKKPLAHGSSSVPDAIMNDKVVRIWLPQVVQLMNKRIDHHIKTVFK